MKNYESLDLAPGLFAAVDPPTLTALVGRRLPNGLTVPVSVDYAVVDGKAIHQGDIVLGDAVEVAAREKMRHDDKWALVVTSAGETWPGGIVPIGCDKASANLVAATVAYLQGITPFKFVAHGGETDYLYAQSGSNSDSHVGRIGGLQLISAGPSATVGTFAHEVCHALGLWHEQCRPDRDAYVTINQANIVPGYADQFAIQQTDAAKVGAYDCTSIMHYPGNAYAKPGTETITRHDGGSLPLRSGLSNGDVAGLAALYPALFV